MTGEIVAIGKSLHGKGDSFSRSGLLISVDSAIFTGAYSRLSGLEALLKSDSALQVYAERLLE